MIRVRKAVFPVALAILIGCGGSSTVSNAAHLRFFDALNDTGNVRLYVGGHLYQVGGDTSIENGDSPRYGDVPSGTVSLILNKYGDQNTGTNTSTLASLTSQTLLEGRNYTAVALLSGTTKKLVLLSDNSTINDQYAFFRIINANNTTSPLYIQAIDKASGSSVYTSDSSSSSGLASGASSGQQYNYYGTTESVGGEDITIKIYSDSDMTNEIASHDVGLATGKSVTTFIYNTKSGGGLSFKDSTDQDTNVTVTTTTGTTGDTTGTTSGTAGTTSGTTATSTTGTTAL